MEQKDAPRKEWDVTSLAFLGAVLGLIGGSAYEMWEAFSKGPSEFDPFTRILAEGVVAALIGALVFAIIAEIRNRLVRRKLSKHRE